MMRFIMGDPDATAVVGAVQRFSDRYERGLRIEDSCLGLIQFANGAQATIQSDLTDRSTHRSTATSTARRVCSV